METRTMTSAKHSTNTDSFNPKVNQYSVVLFMQLFFLFLCVHYISAADAVEDEREKASREPK